MSDDGRSMAGGTPGEGETTTMGESAATRWKEDPVVVNQIVAWTAEGLAAAEIAERLAANGRRVSARAVARLQRSAAPEVRRLQRRRGQVDLRNKDVRVTELIDQYLKLRAISGALGGDSLAHLRVAGEMRRIVRDIAEERGEIPRRPATDDEGGHGLTVLGQLAPMVTAAEARQADDGPGPLAASSSEWPTDDIGETRAA